MDEGKIVVRGAEYTLPSGEVVSETKARKIICQNIANHYFGSGLTVEQLETLYENMLYAQSVDEE